MKVKIKCSVCGEVYEMDSPSLGKKVQCSCGEEFTAEELKELKVIEESDNNLNDAVPSRKKSKKGLIAISVGLLLLVIILGVAFFVFKDRMSLPKDDLLKVSDAVYPSTSGLASGSSEAQQKQKTTVEKTGLSLEVKTEKTDIHFRLVPAGTFMMGSPSSEEDRDNDEKQHRVTLSKAYYVGKYEVTQAQWEKVMGDNPSDFTISGENAPVEKVSWNDCQKFLKKLNKLEGVPQGTYRLLTEAEWEYACRAGTDTAFCYGDSLNSRQANFDGKYPYGGASKDVDREKTISAGSFKPNAFGLYDMHGNVWEWCSDWYGSYPTGSVTDPTGASSGSFRVLRGGSWYFYARSCRSANRYGSSPVNRYYLLGFRLARNIPVRK